MSRRTLNGVRSALAALLVVAAGTAPATENEWEEDIRAFERLDAEAPPPEGAILFLGSSSIVRWETEQDFPDLEIVNRGFGGSQISDSIAFAERIVFPYRPRLIVFYAGDNDIAGGKTAADVFSDFEAFVRLVHAELPRTRIVFIAIKPSLERWELVGEMRAANAQVRDLCETDPRLTFLDVDTPMIGEDGQPRPELFVEDGLHLSREGYDLWNRLLRPHLSD